jgi:hypothetical protein
MHLPVHEDKRRQAHSMFAERVFGSLSWSEGHSCPSSPSQQHRRSPCVEGSVNSLQRQHGGSQGISLILSGGTAPFSSSLRTSACTSQRGRPCTGPAGVSRCPRTSSGRFHHSINSGKPPGLSSLCPRSCRGDAAGRWGQQVRSRERP